MHLPVNSIAKKGLTKQLIKLGGLFKNSIKNKKQNDRTYYPLERRRERCCLRSLNRFLVMYSQSFSGKELYRLTTQAERREFKLEKDAFIQAIDNEISSQLSKHTYSFNIKNIDGLFLNGHPQATRKEKITHLCQDLILRKIYYNTKKIYGIKQANRNRIIQQLQVLLGAKTDFWIIRLDIKSFYESLNRENILGELYKQYRLSPLTVFLLQKLFNTSVIKISSGIPRGLSISSCLSELAMKYFDIEMKQFAGVYYYARFVDDIIIFCFTEKCLNDVWNVIPEKLKNLSLSLNTAKSYKIASNDMRDYAKPLIYLGYCFYFKNKDLYVDIAPAKVNKIKTRIVRAFINATKNGDIELLKDRIKYLTGNYLIKGKTTLLPVKAGIYYNYKRINTKSEALQELDRFYQNILYSYHGRFGLRLSAKLSEDNRNYLKKYSFKIGFLHHTYHHFTPERIHQIKICWS